MGACAVLRIARLHFTKEDNKEHNSIPTILVADDWHSIVLKGASGKKLKIDLVCPNFPRFEQIKPKANYHKG
jgi:hypothetical protein